MATTYRTAQGTIIPTMFIGLGGMGSRIVDRIAARAARLPNWDSQLKPLTSFVSIDTNKLDQNQLRHVPAGNRVHIGAFDKRTVVDGYKRSNNIQALQWLDPAYEPRKGIKPGAGQIRVESRLGFFYQSPQIHQRLKQLVDDTLAPGITWRQSSPKLYNIYLYTTLAGGTGSGSFLSMAYMIQKIIRDTNEWQPRVIGNLLLSTLLENVVGKDLHADIHANTYAALKELEHMTKLNYKQERDTGRSSEQFAFWNDQNAMDVPTVDSAPFFLAIIYDRPANFAITDTEAVVADAAFLQVFTPNIDNMASALDNYEKHLEELTRFPGELRNVGKGYAKNFGAMGAAAMVLPGEDLLEYSALRFAAESVRSQITFGLDASDPADDRMRALAKLAVNYSDPKFLAMGDEGRDRAINQAFLESVRELARQDERQDLKDGFWYQLVESVDVGRQTGQDEKGQPQRAESTVALVRRKLEEVRRPTIQKVSIKERAFTFHREGVNQYTEMVSRLKDEIRAARVVVEQDLAGLRRSALEGEAISDLKLDPISERYLTLRLMGECEGRWIPDAQKQFDQAKLKDINDSKVSDRFEEEYRSLQEAAGRRSWNPFGAKDDEFYRARDQAQDFYRSVAAGARKLFDAEVQLAQFRELLAYLQRRARQYARLARHMNKLVVDLEQRAELLRRGTGAEPRLALSVEVFETLEEPRRRIWDLVYRALYVDGGRYLSTFDRNVLAQTISRELKPRVREDGSVADKTDDELVADLREALLTLGRARLRPTIFGEGGDWGLDLNRGLELEARLELARLGTPVINEASIRGYMDQKFRALGQVSGVIGRVRTAEWRAFDDGVLVDRTRYLTHGFGGGTDATRVPKAFLQRLTSVLEEDGRAINICHWHDPRLAIVYDVELPIPLYYVAPVGEDIERAYLRKLEDKKGYNLHVDKRWEESLPNLNPRAAELGMSWAIRTFATGLVSGTIQQGNDGVWVWFPDQQPAPEILDRTLATSLYEIGELRKDQDAANLLDRSISKRSAALTVEELQAGRQRWRASIESALGDIALRQRRAQATAGDVLDRPVLRVLQSLLERDYTAAAAASSSGYRLT